MKECVSCGRSFTGKSWECPSCHYKPQRRGECLLFSPELAEVNSGFEGSYFERLSRLEADNFWFQSRNRLIIWAIQHYFPKGNNFFEIGCGTGFVLSAIERNFPSYSLYGSEISSAGLPFAKERLKKAHLFQMDARQIPFKNEFDIIGAFDTLEHIAEDDLVLSQIYKALSVGGGIILTVPQHPFLWSRWDEMSRHKRRYSRPDLLNKVQGAGFRVLRITSFVTLLLPVLVVSRLRWRVRNHSGRRSEDLEDLNVPPLINTLFQKVCDIEGLILKKGLSFPAGGSLLCVGVKKEVHGQSKVYNSI